MPADLDENEHILSQQLHQGEALPSGRRASLLLSRASVRRARAQQALDPGHGHDHGHSHGHEHDHHAHSEPRTCDPREDLRGAWADLDAALGLWAEAPEPRMEAATRAARAGLRHYALYALGDPGLLEPGSTADAQLQAADQDLEAAIALFAAMGDARGQLLLLHSEGQRRLYLGDRAGAERAYTRAAPLAEALGDAWSLGAVADGLAQARA